MLRYTNQGRATTRSDLEPRRKPCQKSLSAQRLVSVRLDPRDRPCPVRAQNLRPRSRRLPPHRRRGRRARRRLLAPPAAALARTAESATKSSAAITACVFNAAGRCTFMPAQKTINPSACVRAYPVVERHRLVWVWPGDPALADPAADARFPLERRDGMGRRGRNLRQPQMRLSARDRQSDGPDPRDLRPFRQHRPRRDPRFAV